MGQMGSAPFASTRRRRRDGGAFSPLALYANGEAGGWYDPSDLTPEKVSWRRNLLTWSEQFDNSAWTKQGATVTANTAVDPNGTTTADALVPSNATNAASGLFVSESSGVPKTLSAYVKKGNKRWAVLLGYNGVSNCWFDLDNGVVGTRGANFSASSISNVGNGWYRIVAVMSAALGGNTNVGVYCADADNSLTCVGDGSTVGILLWGAQLELGTTASSYQRITDVTSDFLAAFPQHALYQDSAGTTPVTALGQPVGLVLDKSKGLGSGALGFEQMGRRNLLTRSEEFDNAAWTKQRVTVTANAGTDPNGATTADLVYPNTNGNADEVWRSVGVSSDVRLTMSIYAKAAGKSFIALGVGDAVANVVFFDVANGTVGAQGSGASGLGTIQSASITAAGNGWYRCVVNITSTATTSVQFTAMVTDANNSIAATASGTNGVLMWGAQFEVGTVATPYQQVTDTWYNAVPGAHAIQATSASRPTCDARVNLLTYSQQLTNAPPWATQSGAGVTENTQTAPDGTTTADTVTLTTAANSAVYQLDTNVKNQAGTHTLSVWVRVASGTAQFQMASYSPTDNVAYSSTFTATTTWQRFSWTRTVTVATNWYPVLNDGTLPAATLFVWGVQLETGSTATTYQRVVTASDYADVQAPRYLTFDGVDDSLYTAASVDFATWTSGTRRNLLTYPSAFDNSAWTKVRASITANSAVAPDGTTTADKLIENTANDSHLFVQNPSATLATTSTYTYSVYVKAAERSWVQVLVFIDRDYFAYFNTSNGTIGSTQNATGSIQDVGNGWYRCSITFTPIVAGTSGAYVFLATANNTRSYTGDGTSGILVWGAQLELGSTATAFQDVGTDKMTVVTGVRKLSDAAVQIIMETSTDAASFNGATRLGTTASMLEYFVSSRGTAFAQTGIDDPAYLAPVTNVVSSLTSITPPSIALRINSATVASSTATQGDGTYGTYVMYVGRRNNASLPFNGRIYQLIVRGAQTDTATVQQTERFVAGKTGLVI